MKVQLKLGISFFLLFFLTTITLNVAFSTGTPVVTPGSNSSAVLLGAVKFRNLSNSSSNPNQKEFYLGIHDLESGGAYRVDTDLTWGDSNQITFAYDPLNDQLTASVSHETNLWSLVYDDFSINVKNLSFSGDQDATDFTLAHLNYMQIDVTVKDRPPSVLNFEQVFLDGIPVGSFQGDYKGTLSWMVTGYDFSDGFSLTGDLNLSGLDANNAKFNVVEVRFGYIDDTPPVTSNVLAAPNPADPGDSVTLTATITDPDPGSTNIQNAEYRVDTSPWTPMDPLDGIFDSPVEDVMAVFTAPVEYGSVDVCVRGVDGAGNSGDEQCTTLVVADSRGPITSDVLVDPSPVSPGGGITSTAVVSDTSAGNSNIKSAEYSLNGGGWLSMQPLDGTADSPTESFTVSTVAPSIAESYSLCVRGTDSFDNVGDEVCTSFSVVDDLGPQSSNLVLTPQKVKSGDTVTLTATVDDNLTGGSHIQSAEYNLDGGEWTGMSAVDATFDSPSEDVTVSFPAPLSDGSHEICVRGMDSVPNLGAQECITFTVDNQGPLVSTVNVDPNPAAPQAKVMLTASIDDTSYGSAAIQSAEYQLTGSAWHPMSAEDGSFDSLVEIVTVELNAPSKIGSFELCVRGSDALGNLGPKTCASLTILPDNDGSTYNFLPVVLRSAANP